MRRIRPAKRLYLAATSVASVVLSANVCLKRFGVRWKAVARVVWRSLRTSTAQPAGDVLGPHHSDSRMAMLLVIPSEERRNDLRVGSLNLNWRRVVGFSPFAFRRTYASTCLVRRKNNSIFNSTGGSIISSGCRPWGHASRGVVPNRRQISGRSS